MSEYDTTEKVERTDLGFRMTIECTRGTGTRDQDKVKAELRTEEVPWLSDIEDVRNHVQKTMERQRAFDPDAGDDDE